MAPSLHEHEISPAIKMNVSLLESVKINDDAVHETSAPYLIDIIRGRDRDIGLSVRPLLYRTYIIILLKILENIKTDVDYDQCQYLVVL